MEGSSARGHLYGEAQRMLNGALLSLEGSPLFAQAQSRMKRLRLPWGKTKRAIAAAAICWVPLVLLTLMEGPEAWRAFYRDGSTHGRMLISVPMFILLDRWVGDFVADASKRMHVLMKDADRPEHLRIAARTQSLFGSPVAEAVLLVLTYAAIALRAVDRFGVFRPWEFHGAGFSVAGLYFLAVSLPAFYFLALRWLWRYAVWVVYLARCSRKELRLVAIHPDASATLGFVGRTQVWFSLIAVALEWALTARWAEDVVWGGIPVQSFAVPASVVVVAVVVVFAAPTLFFLSQLWRVRFGGLREFEHFTTEVSRTFEKQWLPDGDPAKLLDESPSSALIDLHSVREEAHKLKLTPLSVHRAAQICLSALGPMMLPVVSSVPLTEILSRVAKAVL